MIKFIKNLFKKKEVWVFASYFVLGKNKDYGFGYLCKPYREIYKKDDIIYNIINFVNEIENNKKDSVVILYYNTWEQ